MTASSDPAKTASQPTVQTVLGPIPAAGLGVTLPHEHFLTGPVGPDYVALPDVGPDHPSQLHVSIENRGWVEYNWEKNRHNLLLDEESTAVSEAIRYRLAGGSTVVDVTPNDRGRDPRALARVSEQSGLHIVMGTAYYVASTHPDSVAKMTQEDLTNLFVHECTNGVDGTGIKAGIIGEIGCSWPLLDVERKVLRAAAAAQRETGAGLTIHPGKHPDAPEEILDIVESEGATLSRVIICHIERTVSEDESLLKLLDRGCFIEYDQFGWETTGSYYRSVGVTMPSDSQRIQQIIRLSGKGHAGKILISHDICYKHLLSKYGGTGYDHILSNAVPLMLANGMTQTDIDELMIHNPRRALVG